MANILARYGIKEVADVTFYNLDENGQPTNPVLYLDTLKVSTIEQTAESSEAKGGKGNATLISWDFGKEITVSIEDALFSAKSLAIMFGNGTTTEYKTTDTTGASASDKYIMKTEQFNAKASGAAASAGWNSVFEGPDGKGYNKLNPKFYNAEGATVASTSLVQGEAYFCTYDLAVDGAYVKVDANTFPGTYYVTGDTWARSEASGKDEAFQFIIPKAKVQSENTLTLEADGDPSVFNMSLKVLRPADGCMMRLVKYNFLGGTASAGSADNIPHNHALDPVTE